jgi:hypothetical protein
MHAGQWLLVSCLHIHVNQLAYYPNHIDQLEPYIKWEVTNSFVAINIA